MRPYYHLFCQEQPGVSTKMLQKVLSLVTREWYSNFYMSQELASKYNMWQVGSGLVYLKVYQKSKVGQELMYKQHRQMVCGELHICHDLVLDQNVNYNTYSTPFHHEAMDVYHKIVMMVIGLYHNTFHIFVCNISIILNTILSVCLF